MERQRKQVKATSDLISAEEMACFAYCPEQWRLQHGLGLEPVNRAARAAGTRHHERKAIAERIAGGSIGLGKALLVAAALVLGFLLWLAWQ